jgi:hypothetical protein
MVDNASPLQIKAPFFFPVNEIAKFVIYFNAFASSCMLISDKLSSTIFNLERDNRLKIGMGIIFRSDFFVF